MAFNKRDYKEFDHLVNNSVPGFRRNSDQSEVDDSTTETTPTEGEKGPGSILDRSPRFWVSDLLYRLRKVTQAAGLELLDTCDSHSLAVFLSHYETLVPKARRDLEPSVWW